MTYAKYEIKPCKSMRGWETIFRNGKAVIHVFGYSAAMEWIDDHSNGLDLG